VFNNTHKDEICHHAFEMHLRFYRLSPLDLRYLAFQLDERNGLEHPFRREEKLDEKDWDSQKIS